MRASENLLEAERLMTVCNSCRYCEGLCAVFPAMELRRTFLEGDLNHLANLCHSCGACYDDCQFTPPHEFAVNVPRTLASVRRDSWQAFVWPAAFRWLFERNAMAIAMVLAVAATAFLLGTAWSNRPEILFGSHSGPGAFYVVLSHNTMAVLFGVAFLYAILAIAMGVRRYWRSVNEGMPLPFTPASLWQATRDASTLRYLDGGGVGCLNEDEEPGDSRTLFHHLTFYGFLACFAATSVATLYHYGLGREAPYPWYDLPVVLGTLGGIGLIVGPAGLVVARYRRREELTDPAQSSMDDAFSLMLIATSASGLALLVLRETPAMGLLLAAHLGVVFAFFVMLPNSRFVHGVYRFVALVRHAQEMRALG
jgi:citrate/tricarballylate utilization protein